MARISMDALKTSCQLIEHYDPKSAQAVRETEQEADQYEDMLGTYLVKLGRADLNAADSRETRSFCTSLGTLSGSPTMRSTWWSRQRKSATRA